MIRMREYGFSTFVEMWLWVVLLPVGVVVAIVLNAASNSNPEALSFISTLVASSLVMWFQSGWRLHLFRRLNEMGYIVKEFCYIPYSRDRWYVADESFSGTFPSLTAALEFAERKRWEDKAREKERRIWLEREHDQSRNLRVS